MGYTFDRRRFLKMSTASVLGAVAAVNGQIAFATEPSAHTFQFGEFEVTVLSDGMFPLPVSTLAPMADPDELKALLEQAGADTVRRDHVVNVTAVRRGNELVLIDTGGGMNFMETTGLLVDSLEVAGIDPAAVTKVVLTHAHPDHVWGVIDDFEEAPRFPNAGYAIGAAEWDYWMADDIATRLPDRMLPFAMGAQRNLKPVAEMTERVHDGHSVMSGVTMVSTPGHTVGHMSVMLESGGSQLLITGDALTHQVVSFQRPDWHYGLDQDAELAAQTRQELLGMLAADNVGIVGYHLPWPGVGRVEAGKDGTFRYIAEA